MAAMLAATPASAQEHTGNTLYQDCQRIPFYCQGVAVGAIIASWSEVRNANRCVPDGVNAYQLADVLLNYLRDHPEERHEASPVVVAKAIKDAWSCPEAQ